MPVGGTYLPGPDLDEIDANASAVPVPQSARTAEAFGAGFDMRPAVRFGRHLVLDTLGQDPDDPLTEENPQGDVTDRRLDPETLNARYGVPGYLRFNTPVSEGDAAAQAAMAHSHQFRDTVFADTNPQPLTDFGAGLAGSLLNPVNLAIMAVTGGLGEVAVGAFDVARAAFAARAGMAAADAIPAISTLGRVANAAGAGARALTVGAIDNAPFVGINAALTHYAGDDYSAGDALRDIAAGAILHTTSHLLFRGAGAFAHRFGDGRDLQASPDMPPPSRESAFVPNPVPAAGVPEAVDALPETARRGAFVKALDDVANDRPVDVGQYVDRENNPATLSALDEGSAAPAVESFRPLEEATAVTTRGTEVPVRYGLAELADLTTSHDDNLAVNGAYPAELQPRERERIGAQARNFQLESELNPKLLMNDVSAAGGAPIVAPDGVVESGNGRTIALRRSAAKGGEAYGAYVAELKARGFDTTGMKAPVLVRMRTDPMTGSARAGLAREMNADVTERMSVPEQAAADARSIDDASLAHLDGTPAGRRAFAKTFIARVAGDQANALVAPDGALSKAGEERIDAALVAKAYGDPRLVEALFEGADSDVRSIGEALKAAAPAWAAMRAAIARGEVPAGLDLTEALRSAVDTVRSARGSETPPARFIALLVGQKDIFSGDAISPETETMLRLLFRPAKGEDALPEAHFTRPLAADKVASALIDYARLAREFTPGPDLFGVTPDVSTARALLANLAKRLARGDAGEPDLLRPPGKPDGSGDGGGGPAAEARPPVLGVRPPGGNRSGADGGRPSQDRPGPGGEGGGPGPEPAPERLGEAAIAADPELKALADDTAARAAAAGVEPALTKPTEDPDTVAQAVATAAGCVLDAADEVMG